MKLAQHIAITGLTQAEYAERIGVSQAAISRYVTGERQPSKAVMRRLRKFSAGQVTANDFDQDLAEDEAPSSDEQSSVEVSINAPCGARSRDGRARRTAA